MICCALHLPVQHFRYVIHAKALSGTRASDNCKTLGMQVQPDGALGRPQSACRREQGRAVPGASSGEDAVGPLQHELARQRGQRGHCLRHQLGGVNVALYHPHQLRNLLQRRTHMSRHATAALTGLLAMSYPGCGCTGNA